MEISGPAPLAITMGEPSGIGPDLLVTLFARREELELPPFLVFGDAALLRSRAERFGLNVFVSEISANEASEVFVDALPVRQVGAAIDQPGVLSNNNAGIVVDAITHSVAACLAGDCRALITAPIHKASLYAAGFTHPGHTEFLAALCPKDGVQPKPVMMLAAGDLRAIPLTVHVPLVDVPGLITQKLVIETCRIAANDLRQRFRIDNPRIGVTGLNPHAGENGGIGIEDRDIIAPAIALLQNEGMNVAGPLPADTVFHPPHWQQYDVVVAMYHDQALIPVKAIGFDEGVNVTLGLPLIRTSPDHGTALELAGTGNASPNSMLAAVRLADEMSARS